MKTPFDLDFELEFVVAAIFKNAKHLDDNAVALRPDQLLNDTHRRAYTAAINLKSSGAPITPEGLFEQMKYMLKQPTVEDLEADKEWIAAAADPRNFPDHAADAYIPGLQAYDVRRRLLELMPQLQAELLRFVPGKTADQYIQEFEKPIQDLANGISGSDFVGMKSVMDEAMAAIERAYKGQGVSGIATGLKAFDDRHGGLQPGDLLILAGRPSMGKTAVATNWGFHAARNGTGTALFSLEMPEHRIGQRILSQETEIDTQKMRSGVKTSDFPILERGRLRLDKLPLFFEKRKTLNAAEIRSTLRRAKRRLNIGLVIIDYLELIDPMDATALTHEHLGKTTQILKATATELEVPVVLLCQLSRAVEGRDDKRPVMSDLRGSGKIEQDADVIVFAFREEYYLERQAPPKAAKDEIEFHQRLAASRGKLDLITAKYRDGKIGTDTFIWEPEKQLVRDFDQWGR